MLMKNLLFALAIFFSLTSFSQESNSPEATKDVQDISNSENKNDSEEVSFALVERVPIYKGCNKSLDNIALKACFSEKLNKHIGEKFNTKIAENLDIPNGTIVKIMVMFKIDTTGEVVNIVAKTDYPELEAEAIRVINLLPKLEPGYIDGEAVRIPYFVPIKFKISNRNNAPENMQYPTYRGCENSVSPEDLKNCTIEKIMDYVKVSINYELADKLFPLNKSTQFEVSFVINKKGKAENVSAKAHKREMAAEAIRVLKRMPKMKIPGAINGKPTNVPVKFLMTIYF